MLELLVLELFSRWLKSSHTKSAELIVICEIEGAIVLCSKSVGVGSILLDGAGI